MANDIKSVVKRPEMQNAAVTVSFRGHEAHFFSSLVAVDELHGGHLNLLISPLDPDDGNRLVSVKRLMEISFSFPGGKRGSESAAYSFRSSFIGREHWHGKRVIRISFSEKRRYNRVVVPPEKPIAMTVLSASGSHTQHVVNISEGGIGFYSSLDDAVLLQGACLEATLAIPGCSSLNVDIVIKWVSVFDTPEDIGGTAYRCCVGTEFRGLSADDRDRIGEYVRQREDALLARSDGSDGWQDM